MFSQWHLSSSSHADVQHTGPPINLPYDQNHSQYHHPPSFLDAHTSFVPGQDISLVTGTYYYVPQPCESQPVPHTQPGVPSQPGKPLCNLTVPVINEPEAVEPVGSDCGISSTTGSGQTRGSSRKRRSDEMTARPKNTSRKKRAKATNEQASGDLPQAAAVCGVGPSALANPSVVHDANVIHSGMRAEDWYLIQAPKLRHLSTCIQILRLPQKALELWVTNGYKTGPLQLMFGGS